MYCNSDSLRFSVLCIGWLGALVLTAASADAEGARPLGKYSPYCLSLANAGEDGEPLMVNSHSRDGELRTGWASVGHETGLIRDHQLRCEGDRLSGRLAVDVGPLQYVCDLEASEVDGELSGAYTGRRGIAGAAEEIFGTASGRLSPRAAGGDLQMLLHLWSMYTEFGHIRSAHT